MLSHYRGHWSCSLNRLAAEYEPSSWSAVKTSRRVADHAGVELAYVAFPLKYSFADVFLCARGIYDYWLSGQQKQYLIAPRQYELIWTEWPHNLHTILESAWTCDHYSAPVENLKYCLFESLIMYVGEKSCWGNVQLPSVGTVWRYRCGSWWIAG